MPTDRALSRRSFLRRLAVLGTAGVGAGTLFVAPAASRRSPAGTCDDTSNLSEQDLKTREALKYTSDSPHEAKTCDTCRLYEPPEAAADEDTPCGTCQVVKGPIHPEGYCTAWTEQTG